MDRTGSVDRCCTAPENTDFGVFLKPCVHAGNLSNSFIIRTQMNPRVSYSDHHFSFSNAQEAALNVISRRLRKRLRRLITALLTGRRKLSFGKHENLLLLFPFTIQNLLDLNLDQRSQICTTFCVLFLPILIILS